MSQAIQLFHEDGKPAGIFYCSECRIVARTEAEAAACCNRRCECGEPLERYRVECQPCQEKRFAAQEAARRAAATVVADWPGWVYLDGTGRDGYSCNLGELVEALWDNHDPDNPRPWPAYAWCCKEEPFRKATIDDVIERCTEESYEDAADDLAGLPELQAAIDAFNAANVGLVGYGVDFTRCVLLPTFEEAQAQLGGAP